MRRPLMTIPDASWISFGRCKMFCFRRDSNSMTPSSGTSLWITRFSFAILRVPNGVLAVVPECGDIVAEAAREAARVAEAMGIRLPYDDPAAKALEVCGRTAANHASTLQDILRGLPTEIDVINGAVAELGARHGVPTPINPLLTQLVFALEATSGDRIA